MQRCTASSPQKPRRTRPALLTFLLSSFLLLAGMSLPGQASADRWLVLSAAALHFDNFSERRAFTPGIGLEYSPTSKLGFHVGTVSDSFGFQASYAGLNWATKKRSFGPLNTRFIVGATVLHKQFHKNSEPETKVVPFPVIEVGLTRDSVLNISGSPQLDSVGFRNNAVLFFQFKLDLS